MKRILYCFLIACFLFSAGCGGYSYCIPEIANIKNPYFDTSLILENVSFDITIKNTYDKNIEVLWNKTFYIDPSGGTNGLFSFGKEYYYEDKDFQYPETIIFPGQSIKRNLYPISNRYFKRSGWAWNSIGLGVNGVFLTILVDGKEVTEKLIIELAYKKHSTGKPGTSY
ncbi:MAG TPA: hypothetical protein PLD26_05135 [Smithella sp.]|nr:hypothetical protein [Smithella sp.]